MRIRLISLVLALGASATLMAQPASDLRMKIDFPTDVLAYFRANMHNRVEELDKIIAAAAAGNMKEVESITRNGLAKRGNHAPGAPRPGQYVPAEFRALDQGMHDVADALALAASTAQNPPTAKDFQAVLGGISAITATCNTCHKAYRIH